MTALWLPASSYPASTYPCRISSVMKRIWTQCIGMLYTQFSFYFYNMSNKTTYDRPYNIKHRLLSNAWNIATQLLIQFQGCLPPHNWLEMIVLKYTDRLIVFENPNTSLLQTHPFKATDYGIKIVPLPFFHNTVFRYFGINAGVPFVWIQFELERIIGNFDVFSKIL